MKFRYDHFRSIARSVISLEIERNMNNASGAKQKCIRNGTDKEEVYFILAGHPLTNENDIPMLFATYAWPPVHTPFSSQEPARS